MFRCTRFSDDLYTAFPIFTEKTQDLFLKAIHRSLSSRYNHSFAQSLTLMLARFTLGLQTELGFQPEKPAFTCTVCGNPRVNRAMNIDY